MPTVLRSGPYRFFFYSNERNEAAHVHVRRERFLAKIWLRDVTLAGHTDFAPVEVRAILRITRDQQALLIRAWEDFHGQ